MGFLEASTWNRRIEAGLTLGFGPEHREGGGGCHPLLLTDREEGTQRESRRQGSRGELRLGLRSLPLPLPR